MIIPFFIEQYLKETLGMANEALNKGAVILALKSAMHRERISGLMEYEERFISSDIIRQQFLDDIVVGETWFFRDQGPFTYLADHLQNKSGKGVIKILSAPCSTGEEPYSIVMTLLSRGISSTGFSVDGADISLRAIERARNACYGSNAFRVPMDTTMASFFEKTQQGLKVTDQVRRLVRFYHDNLISSLRLMENGPYSVIFCRNLLIYLAEDARQRVFKLLDNLLLPDGILFTGHAETVFWQKQGYVPLKWNRAFALVKPDTKTAQQKKDSIPLKNSIRSFKTGINSLKALRSDSKSPVAAISSSIIKKSNKEQLPVNTKSVNSSSVSDCIREARGLADRGETGRALDICLDCINKNEPFAEAYCLMGIIHLAGEEIKTAEELFLRALYLDPCHYESLVHISLIYRKKGDHQRALIYRERAERAGEAGKNFIGSPERYMKTEVINSASEL